MNSTARSSRRRGVLWTFAVLATAALTGCVGAEPPSDVSPAPEAQTLTDGGTFRVGMHADPGPLDPALGMTLGSVLIFEAMCEKLYNADAGGTVFPQLADDMPVFDEEGTSATVTLRPDMRFQDGTPVNADAVIATLDRFQNGEGSQRATKLKNVQNIEKVDDLTVVYRFSSPMPEGLFFDIFAHREGILISPTAFAASGPADFGNAPVCAGPFEFASRVAQNSVTLVKDEDYHLADQVHFDEIVYSVIPDSSVRATNLRAGDLDAITRVSTTDLQGLRDDTSIVVEEYGGVGFDFIEFNIGNTDGAMAPAGKIDTPWAQSADVRRALELSIDRAAINDVVYGGAFAPACGFMPPNSPLASDAMLECSARDVEEARTLLEKSGYELPVKGTLLFSNLPDFRRMAEVVQRMAGEAGFELTLMPQDSTAALTAIQDGDFELYLSTWTGFVDVDPTIARFVESSDLSNWGKFSNPDVDRLLAATGSELDPAERSDRFAELDEVLRDEMPLVFLTRPGQVVAYSDRVAGLAFRPEGTISPVSAGFLEE
ncbi:ABC transporter substrate-binding protein [Microbacterium sp. MYb62]|uniref:ABC transporter substrate-binding protein n=1 Tax=Microbacterium sp. MYb62 TaxID=1848690 RepID=UPI000CFDF710|nr:ABC transporter substrate-binding protein [Microbacterium sp. MYb62]PRB09818.1 hypothetical protein CQ042_18840 [Microbacterium sp. MYb62]